MVEKNHTNKLTTKDIVYICLLVVAVLAAIFCTMFLIQLGVDYARLSIPWRQNPSGNMGWAVHPRSLLFWACVGAIFWLVPVILTIFPAFVKSKVKAIRLTGRVIFIYTVCGIAVGYIVFFVLSHGIPWR